MATYFWDTSAHIKRYITEIGTNWVRANIVPSAGNISLIAYITPIEIASSLARRIREGSISQRTAQAAQLLIERHIRREYVVIALTDEIRETAISLVRRQPLRAYDAVQLASAIETNHRMIVGGLPPLVFLTSDKHLQSAAASEGLPTDDPEVNS
jgi:uncharacterized protein